MKGVVLCGGQSSRMGTDKGMLKHHSIIWAQLAADKLASLQLPIILSTNQQQYSLYQSLLKDMQLVEDNSELAIAGPLKGILSVHLHIPREDLLILACDMPSMQIEVLRHLLTTCNNRNEEAFVFQNKVKVEPLCGIYTARGLNKILQLYQKGELKRYSMLHAISCLRTYFLPVPPQWENCFMNFNTPEDLKGLRF
ncbi:MAG: molybdenum cofactor guanylyltransferase [Flavisolibacter sp.]|nr:molybdenum cofactor guanylyltransferase [Flavisolibacter sp.]